MGTYNLPRDVKGEGRILFIFTAKSLIYTAVGGGIGLLVNLLLQMCGLGFAGIVVAIIFAFIGFSIGTFKVPNITGISWAAKNAGENIDDVIKRAIKFKQKGNRIYVLKEGKKVKEERTDDK